MPGILLRMHLLAQPVGERAHGRGQMPVLRIDQRQRNGLPLDCRQDAHQAAGFQVRQRHVTGDPDQPQPFQAAAQIGVGVIDDEPRARRNRAFGPIDREAPVGRAAGGGGLVADDVMPIEPIERVRRAAARQVIGRGAGDPVEAAEMARHQQRR